SPVSVQTATAAASGQTPKRGGVIRRTTSVGDVQHWDPALDTSNVMYAGGYDIYSKLLKWDAAAEQILPDLCDGQPQVMDDGLTYVYKLRPGTKFADGSPLTSEDVAFTYLRLADKSLASPHTYKVGPLLSATTPDPLTVVFKLGQPFV